MGVYHTPELLSQFGIERPQKRLVEIRHRLALIETGEEGRPVHPVERRRRPIQNFDEAQPLQAPGIRDLLEQGAENRSAQVPHGFPPTEPRRAAFGPGLGIIRSLVARPKHPRGENAVEQRLYQRGVEEARAPRAFEPDAQGLFERRAQPSQRRRVARRFDPREPVARVGGEEPRDILWVDERSPMGQRAGQVLSKTGSALAGEGARMLQLVREGCLGACETEGLERRSDSARLDGGEPELSLVRRQDQPVAFRRSAPPALGMSPACRRRTTSPRRRRAREPVLFAERPAVTVAGCRVRSRGGRRPGRPCPPRRTPWA